MAHTYMENLERIGGITLYVTGTIVLALVIQLIIKVFKLFYNRQREIKKLKEFTGPESHWLKGSMNRTGEPTQEFTLGIEDTKQYGGAFITHNGPLIRILNLTTPENIQTVLSTGEPKSWIYSYLISTFIGDGLLVSKGNKWKRNRRLLTPSFHFEILKPYQAIFSNSANVMVKKWRSLAVNGKTTAEMFEHVSLMTLDSLMKCIFGQEGNYQEGKKSPYIEAVCILSNLLIERFFTPILLNHTIYYFSPSGFKFRKYYNISTAFSQSVINSKKAEKINGNEKEKTKKYRDFLDMLLDCHDEDGNGLTDEEIQHEVDTFMFEGHDTTASGISWCLYNLARHPEYQEKCRQEVDTVLGERDTVEWDDLSKMTFLTMCIKESLRMHPPVCIIARDTTNDHKLPDGRVIPSGTWVSCGIFACHHNPDVWPDPETYDPYRFTPDEVSKRHSYAFVPFSAGPRNCIGQNFAMNELKTAVALVVKNFELSVAMEKPPPEYNVTLVFKTKDGIWLNLKPR